MRRPVWLGAGIAVGVGGTLWAEQRVRRRVRLALDALSPAVAGAEAVRAAREMGGRLRDALDAARVERHRHEAELWRRMGEVPPARAGGRTSRHVSTVVPGPRGGRRRHR